MIMHPITRKRALRPIQLHSLDRYEDGDLILKDPISVLARIFHHESRSTAKEGVVFNYTTTIHVDTTSLVLEDILPILRVTIGEDEYSVQGSSLVENPMTQKITTLVLKL